MIRDLAAVLLITTILLGTEWLLIRNTGVWQYLESLPENIELVVLITVAALHVGLSDTVWRNLRGRF